MGRAAWAKTLLASALLTMAACQGGLLSGGRSGGDNASDPGAQAGSVSPSDLPMRHLLKREVLASYAALLGATPSVDANVLLDDSSATFDNDVSSQSVTDARLAGLLAVAKAAADDAVTSQNANALLGCPAGSINAACLKAFVPRFGERVYRRPLSDDEVADYLALYATESDPLSGARLVVRTMLSSPQFFFQPEVGTAVADKPGYVALTDYEVASKLSLLLLGEGPSDALLAQAQAGQLHTPDQVGTAAHAMLASSAGTAYLRNFGSNWLGLSALGTAPLPDLSLPNDSVQARLDMREETLRMFADFAAPGQKLSELFTADYTYVSPALAPIYGVSAPAAGTWQKISLTGTPRLGVLSQPSILSMAQESSVPSIKRGHWLRTQLFCETLPGTPDNIPALASEASSLPATASERQRLANHLANGSCSSCHIYMEPLGYGLEQFDNLGNYRSKDSFGNDLTGVGEFAGANAFSFTGVAELARAMAASDEVDTCVASKLSQYLLGAMPASEDAALVASLKAQLANNDVPSAIEQFVRSDAFLYRKQS